MDKMEKYEAMNKVLRELEDVKNSETSVLKKIAQIEAENINYGFNLLDKSLPEAHDFSDKLIERVDAIINDFTEFKDKFAKDNNLEVVETVTTEA